MRVRWLLAASTVVVGACASRDAGAESMEIVLDSAEASLGELDHVSGLVELPD